MAEYVISVNEPWGAKSYVASKGGYTFDKGSAKVYQTSEKAYAEFYMLCNANTSVARYGQVEEV